MDAPTSPTARPRRCTADYRWTLPKVAAFLEALAARGSVAEAAAAVGMSRQSAYRLRARLAGTPFAAAFAGARRTGLKARAAASAARVRSRWEGPGLADYLRRHAGQGDTPPGQGDGGPAQGDSPAAQGDARPVQGDAFAHKATGFAPGRGPCGPAARDKRGGGAILGAGTEGERR